MSEEISYRQYQGSAAENYERYFVPAIGRPVSGDLLGSADLRPGERVLDVACGTGLIARLAAEQVGTTGTVVGVDVAPDMIEVAGSVGGPPEPAIDWREGDAAALPLPDDAFDVVLCQMGLMFVDDKAAAAAEMRRVLASGGRLAVNTPGAIQEPFEIMDEELARHISPDLAGFVRVVFSMHEPGAVASLLEDAGFQDVEARSTSTRLRLPPPADFLWQYIHLTPMGQFVEPAPDDAKAALERAVVSRWQEFVHDGATVVEQPMVVATARTDARGG